VKRKKRRIKRKKRRKGETEKRAFGGWSATLKKKKRKDRIMFQGKKTGGSRERKGPPLSPLWGGVDFVKEKSSELRAKKRERGRKGDPPTEPPQGTRTPPAEWGRRKEKQHSI